MQQEEEEALLWAVTITARPRAYLVTNDAFAGRLHLTQLVTKYNRQILAWLRNSFR